MKIRSGLIMTALVCALSLSACGDSDSSRKGENSSQKEETSSAASVSDDSSKTASAAEESKPEQTVSSESEPAESIGQPDESADEPAESIAEPEESQSGENISGGRKTGYTEGCSFSLAGKWKYIKIDRADYEASGLDLGDYYRQHEDDEYKIYSFRGNSICYNETDNEFYPYTYHYLEYVSEKSKPSGIEIYVEDPSHNYNSGKLYIKDDIGFVRVAEDKLYGHNFILIRISDDPGYEVPESDRELFENITGKWGQVNGGPDPIIFKLYADGSARIYESPDDDKGKMSYYGIQDGVLYLDYYPYGIKQYSVLLMGEEMTLNGTDDFHRYEKDGYETQFAH